jgi:hypothetical protein
MMIDGDWRQPFIDYLSEQKVPSDKNSTEQLIRRAKSYVCRCFRPANLPRGYPR